MTAAALDNARPTLRKLRAAPDDIWRAPLVPVALAATAGIVLDRYFMVPVSAALLVTVMAIGCWVVAFHRARRGLGLIYLLVAMSAMGSAYHHYDRNLYATDDVGNMVSSEQRPGRLRGILVEEPTIVWQPPQSELESVARTDSTRCLLSVRQMQMSEEWVAASGRTQLLVSGHLTGVHVGDEVEVVGRIMAPQGPANPGEFDYASYLQDQRIRTVVIVRRSPAGVTRLSTGWPRTLQGWLAIIRNWGQRVIQDAVGPEQGGVATALLLGDGSTMTNADWDKYIHTGVIHVLAISGQHLVILAWFLWLIVRLFRIRRSRAAWFVGLFLLGYALLTGGHPPVMRSAATVGVACLAMILRRPAMTANSFALAWLVVVILNPTDMFNTGCQLSFLSVAVLYWGTNRLAHPEVDPLERLVEESRSPLVRTLRTMGRQVFLTYAVTVTIWLALAPLVAARYHMISLIGLLIGPPLVLLTSIALVAGFLLLLATALGGFLAPVFAWIVRVCLACGEFLVDRGNDLPGGYVYVGDIPDWWLWIFYLGLLAALMLQPLRERARALGLAAAGWLCVGLLGAAIRLPIDELRCTFLAVGHGGCTVLETPDGRVILYDAGALTGPEVSRRQIAPYLWSRGIHRIDEVILSHADLDHFNGLPALLERFAVGQVTTTPTFQLKDTPGVARTLAILEARAIPIRVVQAGDRLGAGDVEMHILHPPAVGPEGNENARSLVLLVRHAGHHLLLTGDLEGPGLERVLSMPRQPVDVLQAPHHGSRLTNRPELAAWAHPRMVVSCEGLPRGRVRPEEPYSALGAQFLGTWPHGAITIHSHSTGLVAETYQSRQRIVVRRGFHN